MLAATILWRSSASSQLVALRESAEVKGAEIRLSELLPPGAPLALREASSAIEVGQSPQPGSVRTFQSGQLAHALGQSPDVLRQISIPDRVLVRRSGWVVQRAAIRSAIGGFFRAGSDGSSLPDSALQAPVDIAATERDPVVKVVEVARDLRGNGSEFRLRCVPRAVCSSFVAHVVEFEAPRPGRLNILRALPDGMGPFHATPAAAAKATVPIVAKAGSRATLLLESANMSISLPVICLERGGLRQTIRVLDAASHRVLHAEIVGAGKLHGSL